MQEGRQTQGISRIRATGIGFAAVLIWSWLALYTIDSAPFPPLLPTAVGCLGENDEIARVAAFPVPDDAGFITGSTFGANVGQFFV